MEIPPLAPQSPAVKHYTAAFFYIMENIEQEYIGFYRWVLVDSRIWLDLEIYFATNVNAREYQTIHWRSYITHESCRRKLTLGFAYYDLQVGDISFILIQCFTDFFVSLQQSR